MDHNPRPSGHRATTAVAATSLLLVLAGCVGGTVSGDQAPGGLSTQAQTACKTILADNQRTHSGPHLQLIYDPTASVSADESAMPRELAKTISEVSRADGSLSVIVVDGGGAEPRIALRNASLSTEGERNRPSVEPVAQAMPQCVKETVLAGLRPTAAGTDLGRAAARAAEMVDAATIVWIWSDFVWTAGQGALTDAALTGSAKDAAASAARAVRVDFHGARVAAHGIGNVAAPLLSANRAWLLDYAKALCASWRGAGCGDFTLDPVNSTATTGREPDPLPSFPGVTKSACQGGTITYELPSALLFGGDSAELRSEARELLAEPVQLLKDNQSSTVALVGHTASSRSYTREGLIELSRQRSAAVASLLREEGIAAGRISAIGVGDSLPRHEDLNPDGTQNRFAAGERRVDLTVKGVTSCA